MTDRTDFTTGPVAQRAQRNPLIATANAVEILTTIAADPAVLTFIMGCVVACLDEEEKDALRTACRVTSRTLGPSVPQAFRHHLI